MSEPQVDQVEFFKSEKANAEGFIGNSKGRGGEVQRSVELKRAGGGMGEGEPLKRKKKNPSSRVSYE